MAGFVIRKISDRKRGSSCLFERDFALCKANPVPLRVPDSDGLEVPGIFARAATVRFLLTIRRRWNRWAHVLHCGAVSR